MATIDDLLRRSLAWVDLAIFSEVQRVRARGRAMGRDAPWGAYIGEAEVDEILGELLDIGPFRVDPETGGQIRAILDLRDAELRAAWEEQRAIAAAGGAADALVRLQAAFGLDDADVRLLLVGLAPEVNARYLRLFAWLQDDLGAQHLTPALALRLLADDRAGRLAMAARLSPGAPLIRGGLLVVGGAESDLAFPARPMHVAPRVARWLLQGEAWDPDLLPWCRLEPTDPQARRTVAEAVDGLLAVLPAQDASPVLRLRARSRRDVLEAARHLACRLGAPLVAADLGAAGRLGIAPEPVAVPLAREARLQGAVLLVLDPPEPESGSDPLAPLLAATGDCRLPLVVHAGPRTDTRPLTAGRRHLVLDLPGLTLAEREAAWTEAVAALLAEGGQKDLGEPALEPQTLARRFRYSPGQIAQIVDAARDRAAARGHALPLSSDVLAACAATFLPEPGPLAEKVEVKRGWDDLVLPMDTKALLGEMVAQVDSREQVLEALGDARVRAGERGIKALFSGPPGTGKSLAAEVLARALGYALFRVDLSSVVSKYVGETEKHLGRLFAAADEAPCVLLFDEADALFGKRSEVKGAQDRFANLEVSYLLQRLESFDGVAILTTNLKRGIDEAFLRRFTFVVDFPFPEKAEREQIWARVLPSAFPLAEGLSVSDLAAEFKLAGANIWNVAVAASVAAAQSDLRTITRDMLTHALRREYEKLGREVAALRPPLLAGLTREDEDEAIARGLRPQRRAPSAAEARRMRMESPPDGADDTVPDGRDEATRQDAAPDPPRPPRAISAAEARRRRQAAEAKGPDGTQEG